MNKVILVGRLIRDPDIRYSQNVADAMCIARYTLAVDRQTKNSSSGQPTADFISIVAFGKSGEFAEKFLRKGTKILVEGRIQTGNYTNKEGQKVYTTDVVVDRHEFVESKGATTGQPQNQQAAPIDQAPDDGFMNIPDGIDEELPFS